MRDRNTFSIGLMAGRSGRGGSSQWNRFPPSAAPRRHRADQEVSRTRGLSPVMVLFAALGVLLASCTDGSAGQARSIAVFVPGVLEGSPTYEMMDSGVRLAADKAEVEVKTVEGGFDQATWENQLMALAAEGRYGLIVTSNPAMSELANKVAVGYPDQDFLILDGSGLGRGRVTDVAYDHLEQAFLSGYFAGLVTTSSELKGANEELKVALIAGQEYPQMEMEIRPGFEIGLHAVNPDIELEFRVLGNWYDADKARELAAGLYDSGVDVILTIAGGANQGVVAAAKEAGGYVLWFDSDGTDQAPGVILASSVLAQKEAAERWTRLWLLEDSEAGESVKLDYVDGYVDFPMDGKHYRRHVPESITQEMRILLDRIRDGSVNLEGING